MRGRGRCGRAARRRGGVRAAAGSAQMAGQACFFALAQKEALGLQFARAAPVNTLHVLSATAHDPLPPPCNSNGQPCFLVTTSNSSETIQRRRAAIARKDRERRQEELHDAEGQEEVRKDVWRVIASAVSADDALMQRFVFENPFWVLPSLMRHMSGNYLRRGENTPASSHTL